MTRAKLAPDRWAYYVRKTEEYGARLRSNADYDRWGLRRSRLLSYRNHVIKLCNAEMAAEQRKNHGGVYV